MHDAKERVMTDVTVPVERFAGFPPDAIDFYRRLAADNSKEFWQANKEIWEQAVRDPLCSLLAAVEPDPDAFQIFRPYRDVRFSPDKSPYKSMLGAGAPSRDGTVRYIQISAAGLMIASGCYAFEPDQIARFRAAIDHAHRGARLASVTSELAAASIAVESGGAAEVKTTPRGFSKDHPRIALLRFRGLVAIEHITDPAVVGSPSALDRVRASWDSAAPLRDWLATHVGPAAEPRPRVGR
jgi:uncharacterized protein (TIGR02453 family)